MRTQLVLAPFLPATALILVATALPLQAKEDLAELYQFNCTNCHGAEVYTRANRKVNSLEALEAQVQRCELALGLKWFDEEIAAMSQYLNDHYYHFKP